MRQQKKLAKQKAKRTEKRTQLARQSSTNPNIRLAGCEAWPIVSTMVPSTLWEHGIGNLFIARRAPDGSLVVGCFLLDVFCLGVKNALWQLTTDGAYQESLERASQSGGNMKPVKQEYFAKLIFDGVQYAESIGLAPHADYRNVKVLLGGIDTSLCDTEFEFGKDGRPLFISGPNDTPAQERLIMQRMREAKGNFIVEVGGTRPDQHLIEASEEFDEDDFDEDETNE
jgi:hypothetical protein